MSKIRTAQPGDLYTDITGNLWRIKEVIREPVVCAEPVEGGEAIELGADDKAFTGWKRLWRKPSADAAE